MEELWRNTKQNVSYEFLYPKYHLVDRTKEGGGNGGRGPRKEGNMASANDDKVL